MIKIALMNACKETFRVQLKNKKTLELTLLVMAKPPKFHTLLMSKIDTQDFREIVHEMRQQI